MRRPLVGLVGLVAVGSLALAACSSSSSSSSSSASSVASGSAKGSNHQPITIAELVSTTGPAGPEYVKAPEGFLARIALQNAAGGVDGHKLVPVVVNDGGNFSQETSIIQGAVETKGAFGIVSVTPFMFAGYRWTVQNGIPVTGASSDGPEWTEPANSNMFASDADPITEDKAFSGLTKLFELAGGPKASIAALGYSISPLSSQAATNAVTAAKDGGLQAPYLNNTIGFGSTSFTSQALAIKQSGANVVVPQLDSNSNFALVQDLKQAGAKVTPVLATGLGPSAISSPAWTDLQGSVFYQTWVPTQLHTAATTLFQDALEKYEHIPTSDFPDWAVYEGWLGADLMIKGLEMDGPNPTRAGVIAKLHTLTDYTGGGLLGAPIDYATVQTKAQTDCLYALKAEKTGFVPMDTKPLCGLPYGS
jgi:branched-chain amino acid transport system substrate-binding protein